jgi:GTP-binding protein Era
MVNKNHCGYVAVIGRPNVGKSTLINCLVGQKISITARKPQTTRHRILGIKTVDTFQAIYVDTPGLHKTATRALNQYMNVAATSVINDVDLILFVIDSLHFKEEDEWVLSKLENCNCPIILVINKVDRLEDKLELLPSIEKLNQQKKFIDIFPLSAKKNTNVASLEKRIFELLPESPHYFGADDVTDRSLRFMAAELIREKLIRNLGQEVPHAVTVQIDQFKDDQKLITISATILVERQGQKAIVVGKDGQQLKTIGTDARIEMEKLFDKKVFLRLWVKVKSGWSNDAKALKSLGYD